MKEYLGVQLLLLLSSLARAAEVVDKGVRAQVTYLDAGTIIDYQPVTRHLGFFETDLRTYCYRGAPKSLKRYFESVELQLDIEGDDYTQYEGATPTKVRQHYDERRSLFSFNIFSQKRQRQQLSPFTQQCIGIDTVQPYRVRLQQLRVDLWRVLQLALGISLFVYAGQLSDNSIFYYLTGIALGICSSFMLIIWLSSKLMPRRPMMYGMLIGGWTLGVYIIQRLWDNVQLIFQTYRIYVFWYMLITGLVSFFFCYRLGPPKNKRSKNIIKWIIQFVALILIYLSSHYEEASVVIAIITAVLHYFPWILFYKVRAMLLRYFPPKPRLLTDEEYYEQGVRETTKALEELRAYASSPECKQWKMMSKLRDPLRFAEFVEGASHLRDDEILHFESSIQQEDDDESDSCTDENELNEEHVIERNHRQQVPQRRHICYEEMSEDENDVVEVEDGSGDADVVEVPITTTANRSARSLRHTPTLNNSRSIYSATTTMGSFAPIQRNSPMRQQHYQSPAMQATQRASSSRASFTRSTRVVSSTQHTIGDSSSSSSIQLRRPSLQRNVGTYEYSGESDDY